LPYALGGDHDSDFLDRFSKLLRLDGAIVVEVEVLEALGEHGLFALAATGFLGQLLKKFFFETRGDKTAWIRHTWL